MKKMIIILLLFVICLPSYGVVKPGNGAILDRTHPLARDLVGCWLINEGTGSTVFDYSGNRYDGTLTNMTDADWVAGNHGHALDFDGSDDHVRTGTRQGGQDGYSSLVWVKPASADNLALFEAQADYGDSVYHHQFFQSGTVSSGQVTARVGTDKDNKIGRTAPGLVGGEWQCWAFTWNGGTANSDIQIYHDGIQVDSGDDGSGSFSGAYSGEVMHAIGSQIAGDGGPSVPFTGEIGCCLIWHRWLSDEEVMSLYRDTYQMFRYYNEISLWESIQAAPASTGQVLIISTN